MRLLREACGEDGVLGQGVLIGKKKKVASAEQSIGRMRLSG